MIDISLCSFFYAPNTFKTIVNKNILIILIFILNLVNSLRFPLSLYKGNINKAYLYLSALIYFNKERIIETQKNLSQLSYLDC